MVESKVITPKHELQKNNKISPKQTKNLAENITNLKITPKTKKTPKKISNTPDLDNTEYLVNANLESSKISCCNTMDLLEESLNLNLTFVFTPKRTVKRKQNETPKTKQPKKPKC